MPALTNLFWVGLFANIIFSAGFVILKHCTKMRNRENATFEKKCKLYLQRKLEK